MAAESIAENIKIFHGISTNSLQVINDSANVRYYKSNTYLFFGNQKITNFLYLVKGYIKLFKNTLAGEEIIFDIMSNDHYFGIAGIFDKRIEKKLKTITDVKLIQLPINLMKSLIKKEPTLTENLLHNVIETQLQQELEIEHLTIYNAAQRIGCFLLKLYNSQTKNSNIVYLPYNKTLLANRLGMRAETFSRAFSSLCRQTNITPINHHTFKLPSTDSLKHFVCHNCYQHYPCHVI